MRTSVLTVVWNRSRQAYYGLRSMLVQDEPPDQLIVVDDGSTDHLDLVVDRLKDEFHQTEIEYVYLDHPEARIASYGRNIAMKKCRHEIVISTESEAVHITQTIKQIREKIEKGETMMPVASHVYTSGPAIQEKLMTQQPDYLLRPATILYHPYCQLTDSANLHNTKAPDADWAITGSLNCFVGCLFGSRRENFFAVRGFDEDMDGYGWEDWDFIKRVTLYLTQTYPDNDPDRRYQLCNDIILMHQWHRKDYPFNIYEKAEKNGLRCEDRLKAGEYRANIDHEWGIL